MENASINSIFKEIEKQTGYCFFYNASLVPITHKVNIQITNRTIEEVLVMCLDDLGLEHRVTGRIIALKAKANIDVEQADMKSPVTHYYIVPLIFPFGSRRVRKRCRKIIRKWLK